MLCLAGEPAEVTVSEVLAEGAPSLIAELRGPAGAPGRAAAGEVRPILARMLGLRADLRGFYRVAEGDAGLDALAARFRGVARDRRADGGDD